MPRKDDRHEWLYALFSPVTDEPIERIILGCLWATLALAVAVMVAGVIAFLGGSLTGTWLGMVGGGAVVALVALNTPAG